MKIQALVSPLVLVGAFALAHPAHAKTININGHPPGTVKKNCRGGTYFAPSDQGVYGCLNKDGSGIVCGGTGDNYANTCDTWSKTPPGVQARTKLPARDEIKDHTDNPQ
jgi:aryl-phospho-beta-D-glucosidase BglC (GH1 family)